VQFSQYLETSKLVIFFLEQMVQFRWQVQKQKLFTRQGRRWGDEIKTHPNLDSPDARKMKI
jgi:hypothetical protein